MQCAERAGVQGAREFLQDPNNGRDRVEEELRGARMKAVRGVPHFVFQGRFAVSGAQASPGETLGGIDEKWPTRRPRHGVMQEPETFEEVFDEILSKD